LADHLEAIEVVALHERSHGLVGFDLSNRLSAVNGVHEELHLFMVLKYKYFII